MSLKSSEKNFRYQANVEKDVDIEFDIEQKRVIEERAVKFNESVKYCKYLNNSPENLFEVDILVNNEDVTVKLNAKPVHLDSKPGLLIHL
ncbi:hypothetical protein AVEN_229822-1 [Araneus ventricosus]|uniref:Uncharacterized protein n=1 Tax=Araneus ventricosus TaxID=182803 RepID=A0A4Y2LKF7_ARAVE|nr:hypothetical protein AVEN_229822-1 [Araneus ventricosus]